MGAFETDSRGRFSEEMADPRNSTRAILCVFEKFAVLNTVVPLFAVEEKGHIDVDRLHPTKKKSKS
jgi:hypothetical protein